jgi:ankyrin repeat protein
MIARSDELVTLLLECQADVNAADKQGNTALLLASDENAIRDTSIVRVLLANQADVNAANMNGKTALKASFSSRNEPLFRLLLEHRADNGAIPARALLYAIEHSFDVSFMRTLIELRADVNARTSHGMSALMELLASSWPDHNSLCPLLLEYRADVNLVDQDGMSALMWASGFGNEECNMLNIPLLLKARADIDVMDQGTFGCRGVAGGGGAVTPPPAQHWIGQ